MTKKNEVAKKKSEVRDFLNLYDDQMNNLMKNNLRLQSKALEIIEEKIDQASPAQAATIYGILHDKVQTIVGKRDTGNNTVNMYFGDSMSNDERNDLLNKVLKRMDKDKEVDASFEVVEKGEK